MKGNIFLGIFLRNFSVSNFFFRSPLNKICFQEPGETCLQLLHSKRNDLINFNLEEEIIELGLSNDRWLGPNPGQKSQHQMLLAICGWVLLCKEMGMKILHYLGLKLLSLFYSWKFKYFWFINSLLSGDWTGESMAVCV